MFKELNLTPLQKRIVVAGMDDRQLSPDEIYKAMNTDDRDTYDREVTALRHHRVLLEIRTNQAATAYARLQKIKKRYVPRFKVQIPKDTEKLKTHVIVLKPAPKVTEKIKTHVIPLKPPKD